MKQQYFAVKKPIRIALQAIIGLLLSQAVAYAETPATNETIGRYFQDLKNYMAIQDLEKTKGKISRDLENPPFTAETVNHAVRANNIRSFDKGMYQIVDLELMKYNLYMPNNVGNQNTFVLDHLNTFCSVPEAKIGLCKTDKPYSGPIDLMASTLFGSTVFPSELKKDTALRFVRNLINPVPVPMQDNLTSGDGQPTQKGLSFLAKKYQLAPALTLAQDSLQRMYTDRLSLSYAAGDAGNNVVTSTAVSILSTLEDESNKRFYNENWYTQISTKSEATLLKELTHMMALQLVLDFRRNRRLEKIEAMIAVQLTQSMGFLGKGIEAEDRGNKAAAGAAGD